MKNISIIIVNYNGWEDTLGCLTSLSKAQSSTPKQNKFGTWHGLKARIIVIDNDSTDNSAEEIQKWLSSTKNLLSVELIELKENKGFSGGNNVGIKLALGSGSDYIVLLNNDTLIKPDFLEELVETAKSDNKIGIVGPKIYFAPGFEFHKERYKKNERGRIFWYAGGGIDWQNMYVRHRGLDEVDRGQYDNTVETDFVSGCCMLVKKEVFENIGLLDDELFLYLEDLDFCLRAKKAGYKLIYEPKAEIWHKNASSTGRPGSKLHQYYQTRNRLIVGMRYASFRTKLALLRESLRFLRDGGVKREAVLDFYFYKWGRKGL